MKALIEKYIAGRQVLILGFGREGRSTYRYLKNHFPEIRLAIADKNPDLDPGDAGMDHPELFLGDGYLKALHDFDVIFKSPGIDFNGNLPEALHSRILTQSGLFLEQYRDQIIGITGTKGKSTTSSLIYHILNKAEKNPVLVGNIGIPPFDHIDKIRQGTPVVFEISAHQLEQVRHSPHIAILLNIFEEHLDYFGSLAGYTGAKFKIAGFQQKSDYLITGPGVEDLIRKSGFFEPKSALIPVAVAEGSTCMINDPVIPQIKTDTGILAGEHNQVNIAAAATACFLAGVPKPDIEDGVSTFEPLEHRLEYVGNFGGIRFYNDSISTIPESTIQAVKSIDGTETLILGGYDRGISYNGLAAFLAESSLKNLVFTGPAGRRIMDLFLRHQPASKQCFLIQSFDELPEILRENARPGSACLLSPAASSYDMFKNFEERGAAFKKIARTL